MVATARGSKSRRDPTQNEIKIETGSLFGSRWGSQLDRDQNWIKIVTGSRTWLDHFKDQRNEEESSDGGSVGDKRCEWNVENFTTKPLVRTTNGCEEKLIIKNCVCETTHYLPLFCPLTSHYRRELRIKDDKSLSLSLSLSLFPIR